LARLRSLLLLTLVTGVLAAMAAADVPSSLFDTWGYLSDTEQDASNTITADTLGAPGTPDATAAGVTSINLTWTASNDSYATGYRLFRRTDPGVYGAGVALTEAQTNCVTPGDSSCAHTDTGLTGATKYCYKLRTTYLNWTSAETAEDCATTQTPVELRTLFLSSPSQNANTDCDSTVNTLVTAGASGGCKIDATTKPPFETATWCTTSSIKVTAQQNWTLDIVLDTDNPFQSATLVAQLKSGSTTIATSAPFGINPSAASATVTLVPSSITPPVTGQLCLVLTNQTEDSNPDSGAAHDAKVLTAGVTKIRGPWDP
jgi:hypothetical protein